MIACMKGEFGGPVAALLDGVRGRRRAAPVGDCHGGRTGQCCDGRSS
jgi:hypothetical protein